MATIATDKTSKEMAIEIIRQLPDAVTFSEIVAELSFRNAVEEGLRQLDAGQGIPHAEALKRLGLCAK